MSVMPSIEDQIEQCRKNESARQRAIEEAAKKLCPPIPIDFKAKRAIGGLIRIWLQLMREVGK